MDPIVESFQRLAHDRRGEPALWSRGEGLCLGFGELAGRAAERRRGLEREDGGPIGLALPNSAALVELFVALRGLDLPVVMLDASLEGEARREQCRRLGIARLVEAEAGPGAEPLGGGVWLARPRPAEDAAAPPSGTVLIKLTSGSTGEPLGACFAAERLVHGVRQISEGMEITGLDRVLLVIPLSHSYGFDNGILSLAVLGTPLVLEPSRFPGPQIRALAESEATVFPIVPPLVRTLGESEWPEGLPLRRVISAGGALDPGAAGRLYRASGHPVHNFYGSTETGGISFERRPLEPGAAGTVGQPLPGVEVTLGEGGRVEVASPANLTGYLGGGRQEGPVRMGDTGEWGPGGRLRLTGRTADFLDIGGRKVPAARVEAALLSLPGVEEAAAVGVADPVRGDRVVAFVVSRCWPLPTEGLPAGLAPRRILRIDTLPHTVRGKLDRALLRALASGVPDPAKDEA